MADILHCSPMNAYPRRWSPRVLLLLCLLALCLMTIAGVILHHLFKRFEEINTDAYAQEWTARIVIQYMEWHGGSWPRSWDDLEEPFEASLGPGGSLTYYQTLQDRVVVDFSANPADLAKMPAGDINSPPFRVIYLRSGKRYHFGYGEANILVWEYLQKRARRPLTYQYPQPPLPAEKTTRKALLALGAHWKLDSKGHISVVNVGSSPEQSQFSDADLTLLRPLTRLWELNLGHSNITDRGLANIKDLTTLHTIYLDGTQVTDAGLKHLDNMQDLATLILASEQFTDAAFKHIVKHPKLKVLNLNSTQVTDTGITSLGRMSNLRSVMLGNTRVTQTGVQQLRQALPDCEIYYQVTRR
jgi:hypothetical protein